MKSGDTSKKAQKAAGNQAAGKSSRDETRPDSSEALNEKQQRFVKEYLIDLNATQAAIRAGYSAKTAQEQGSRLLSYAKIRAAVEIGREKTAHRLELTREDVLRQYQRLGFSDVRKMFTPAGQIMSIHELDDDTAAAITGFEVEMRQLDGADSPPVPVLKVKWADKKAALDSIMKAQAWNKTDIGNEENPLTALLKTMNQRSALPVVAVPTGDASNSGSTLPINTGDEDE